MILVTGGAGFIGSHTVEALLRQDKLVIIFDNLCSGLKANLAKFGNYELIVDDILNIQNYAHRFKNLKAVIHLAAQISIPESIRAPMRSFNTNVNGFVHLLEFVRSINPHTRLVYASSAAIYGDCNILPCNESVQSTPISPYALEKQITESYAELYNLLYGMNCIGLRYFNVYGVRQNQNSDDSGVISHLINNIRFKRPHIIYGDGLQTRDFISVKDVVRANCIALESQEKGIFNIATGKQTTVLQLLEHLNTSKASQPIKFESARAGDIKHSYADIEKSAEKLNFRAKILLADGLKELLQYLC